MRTSPGFTASGMTGRHHYIAFEYIEGETVRQRVETAGSLSVADAVDIALQIAHATRSRLGARRGTSRHQAVEHHHHACRASEAGRYGAGKTIRAWGRSRLDPKWNDTGLIRLYQSRASARPARCRCAQRPLFARLYPVSYAHAAARRFPAGLYCKSSSNIKKKHPPTCARSIREFLPSWLPSSAKLMAKDRDRRYQTPEHLVRDLLSCGWIGRSRRHQARCRPGSMKRIDTRGNVISSGWCQSLLWFWW